ncbi:hypothetical protein FB446DRAFT_784650 [Lentinula raphanica]|nr:hypothetical protein FB446DRAFT_784650 [Lentinula raphanica]
MPKKKRSAVLDDSELVTEHNPQQQVFISDDDNKHLRESVYLSSHVVRTSSKPPPLVSSGPCKEQGSLPDLMPPASAFSEDLEKTRTQRARLLAEYSENFALVSRLLMSKEADHRIGSICGCNKAPREAHRHLPFHWAHVWSDHRGYFTCQDISTVLPEGSGISLGHDGERCPKASEPILMTIADVNGIHATKVWFCHCTDYSRWRQLFDIDVFPATIAQPQTAFTFELLRHWTILNLQSKITAHHYVAALRRQTDNVFTGNVPDVVNHFRFITRIWPLFLAEKRSGLFYGEGMKEAFPLRPANDLRNGCFICPEAEVNMEDGWEKTPDYLRHTQSQRWVVDGNMKTGNFVKNSDPNDASIFAGRAYMPSEQQFEHYLKTVPQLQKEKTTCSHLKVANGANTAKYKQQRISGNLHIQCDHGVVLSSVDILLGERLALYDYALNLALEARPFSTQKRPDLVISYDNNCGAVANIQSRWEKYFPQHFNTISSARFTIPACHVRNHVDGCDYLYCYQYKPNTGHFHGETVEATWSIFNSLSGAVLQMGPGHRIDTLIIHYSDWNWRKAVYASRQLSQDLEEAKIQYVSKRDHYAGLCDLFEARVLEWNTWDRSPKIDPHQKKTVVSVYSHNNEKAPTMKSLVESLMSSKELVVVPTGAARAGPVASWLMEGLAIIQLQLRIQRIARTCLDNPSKELRIRRTKLSNRISRWRKLQDQYMPSIGPHSHGQEQEDTENESLLLPSDFTASERRQHGLVGLANKQVQMLEIALGELIQALQTTVKTLSAAYERKHKHASGQDANTRANNELRTIENKRSNLISDYAMFRQNLQALDSLDNTKWPSLGIQDTFRKPTETRRAPGDSRRRDGALWQMSSTGRSSVQGEFASGLIFGNRETDLQVVDGGFGIGVEEPAFDTTNISYRGTRMSYRQANVSSSSKPEQLPDEERMDIEEDTDNINPSLSVVEKKDGWIWHTGSLKHMNASELEKWEDKNDSVQWFRAEADMERWQEQLEIKHAEFLRLIASFKKHCDAWELLATQYSSCLTPGHTAYAKEHRDMFDSLRVDAEEKYRHCAIPFLRNRESAQSLGDRIILWRREEEKLFKFDRHVFSGLPTPI